MVTFLRDSAAIYATDQSTVVDILAIEWLPSPSRRQTIRWCALAHPSLDEVAPHPVPSNDIATINANLSSSR